MKKSILIPISKMHSCRKLKDSKKLHAKAWKLQSLWVRKQGSKNGANRCFTCGVWQPIEDLDCGHYIHGDRFDFTDKNLHPQCTRCNRFLHGNLGVYAHNLIQKYGLEEYQKLESLRFRERHYSIKELEEIIKRLKDLIKNL